MFDWIGWAATAAFTSSYFFRKPASLRRVQAAAALLWLCYGTLIHSLPIIAANGIVAAVAAFSSFRADAIPPVSD